MRIILIVYKIEKNKGSEDGCGYHLALNLLKSTDQVTLISRVNNIKKLKNDPKFKNIDLVGIDVPKPLSYFKKKGRGIILYYYLWQFFVGKYVNKLQENQIIDIIHQLNFHTDWAPHFIKKKHAKIIYGPIGHHQKISKRWIQNPHLFFMIQENLKQFVKNFFWYCDPFVKKTAQNTDIVFYGNHNIAPPYQKYRNKVRCLPYGGSVFKTNQKKDLNLPLHIIFVGRFVHLKGIMLVIDIFKDFLETYSCDAVLTCIGTGRLDEKFKSQVKKYKLDQKVRFVPWINQKDLKAFYQKAHVFLYPSFEAQGLVVSEALSQGCPVICFQGTGPAFIGGDAAFTVDQNQSYSQAIQAFSEHLQKVYLSLQDGIEYQKHYQKAIDRYKNHLTWSKIAQKLREAYEE